jgi:hypothetical protein
MQDRFVGSNCKYFFLEIASIRIANSRHSAAMKTAPPHSSVDKVEELYRIASQACI